MLSTTAEYALRIMILLTESGGGPRTGAAIAQAAKVPADYAGKVLATLRRAGLVGGQRGRRGGFALRCDPRRTTLLDIVDAIEPIERITACPLGREAHRRRLCPLHRRLDDLIVLLQSSLAGMTLQSVVDGDDGPALCRPKPVRLSVSATRRRGRTDPPRARGGRSR